MKKDVKITTENFEKEILQADKPVMVDFYADWCGPCQMLSPIMDEIADERDDIYVAKINTDEQDDLARSYAVSSIPTVLVFRNGGLTKKMVGFRPKEEVLELLN